MLPEKSIVENMHSVALWNVDFVKVTCQDALGIQILNTKKSFGSVWLIQKKERPVVSTAKVFQEHSKGIPEEIIESAFLESYTMISGKDRELVDNFVKRVESTLGIESVAKKIKRNQSNLDEILKKKKKLLNLMLEEQLDKSLFESSMYELGEEEKILNEKIEGFNLKLEYEHELAKRITSLKRALNSDIKLKSFDRHIFESLIEKVIVGKIDENGEVDPYNITFIYKTGLDNTVNGEKYRTDGRKKDSNVLPSNSTGGSFVYTKNLCRNH